MPLVVFCGIPASGKTTHATELEKLLKEKGKEVFLLNEEVLRIDKNEGYKGLYWLSFCFSYSLSATYQTPDMKRTHVAH